MPSRAFTFRRAIRRASRIVAVLDPGDGTHYVHLGTIDDVLAWLDDPSPEPETTPMITALRDGLRKRRRDDPDLSVLLGGRDVVIDPDAREVPRGV